jgi:hypothetical protein
MGIQTASSYAADHSLYGDSNYFLMRSILYTQGFKLLPHEFSIHEDSICFHTNSLYTGIQEGHEGGHLKGAICRADHGD